MKLDFYYWDMQCPLNSRMLRLLNKYEEHFDITTYNVANDFVLAQQQRMFFPTLTVIDGKQRCFAPLSERFFATLLRGEPVSERPYIIELGREPYEGEILPLTCENMEVAGRCIGRDCRDDCQKKAEFLRQHNGDIFGFINVENGKLLGGLEFVPSITVPYDIPKDENAAFLTCAYLSSDKYDYKSASLAALERHLAEQYSKLIAISDEVSTFPNGDLKWFLDNGFKDEGVISIEPGYCVLHLVTKSLV